MKTTISSVLEQFTSTYINNWKQQTEFPPASAELYGIPSPCVIRTGDGVVYWEPQPFPIANANLQSVANALEITLQEDIHPFYTSQLAGDMAAEFEGLSINLLQVWSEEDFTRLQQNLIGHLVTQKRLKLPPTLFIATMESDLEMVSLCNMSGEVIVEKFGSKERRVIAPDLATFIVGLIPVVTS
ncbi:SecY-interacting protein [Moellerella wisconsensis]|uniref:SecY-interacting protein n=1 Tax=Moellerella wisconsensis TaxID=158849 RepID=UPI0025B2789F|nr:SecY-interacting protein [Moellerella wisconsensis]WJW82384.1 SecY-interacting protein [Moellerella wisconsensis]